MVQLERVTLRLVRHRDRGSHYITVTLALIFERQLDVFTIPQFDRDWKSVINIISFSLDDFP